jgi:phytanoyl-CoA hydroxylase
MGSRSVAACNAVPNGPSDERLPARDTVLLYEGGRGPAMLPPKCGEFAIRRYVGFARDAQVGGMVAMNRPLHALPDRKFGDGRALFEEMARVKSTLVGVEKPWHHDATNFYLTDPGMIIGAWIAMDPALRETGWMELVPGSQLDGAVPHHHKNDFNSCRVVSQYARAAERIAIDLRPSDTPTLHAMQDYYISPSASTLNRRAMQCHYHQIRAVWG